MPSLGAVRPRAYAREQKLLGRGRTASSSSQGRAPCVVAFHGFSGTAAEIRPAARRRRGRRVRGRRGAAAGPRDARRGAAGRSASTPGSRGARARLDAARAKYGRVVLLGFSLGSLVAHAARQRAARGPRRARRHGQRPHPARAHAGAVRPLAPHGARRCPTSTCSSPSRAISSTPPPWARSSPTTATRSAPPSRCTSPGRASPSGSPASPAPRWSCTAAATASARGGTPSGSPSHLGTRDVSVRIFEKQRPRARLGRRARRGRPRGAAVPGAPTWT